MAFQYIYLRMAGLICSILYSSQQQILNTLFSLPLLIFVLVMNQLYFIGLNNNPAIEDKLIEMNLSPNKSKHNNLFHSNNKSKLQHACYSCSKLKQQVRTLKALQQKLSKQIHQIVTFVPKQIEYIISKIRKSMPVQTVEAVKTKAKFLAVNNKPLHHNASPQSQAAYECKLKAEDSAIKQSIYKELKMIRALESKEKDLRVVNQKHQTLRKSLSKQSIPSQLKKTSSKPSSSRNIQPNYPNLVNQAQVWTQTNEWISSPKFGKLDEVTLQPNWRYSSQDSKPKPHKLSITISNKQQLLPKKIESLPSSNTQRTQYEVLKCPNGHECYRGDTLNHIPHGGGTLLNCCHKMPFKVNSKTLKYTGGFSLGQFQGKGVLICKDNVKFQGSFLQGLRQGQGIIYLQGSGERGVWQQDKLISFI